MSALYNIYLLIGTSFLLLGIISPAFESSAMSVIVVQSSVLAEGRNARLKQEGVRRKVTGRLDTYVAKSLEILCLKSSVVSIVLIIVSLPGA